jgi:hypothetical protein
MKGVVRRRWRALLEDAYSGHTGAVTALRREWQLRRTWLHDPDRARAGTA